MADNNALQEELLKKVTGGLIAIRVYQCPNCGATEEATIDTGSHDGPKGGDGWCDKCNMAMKVIATRF